MTCEGGRGGNTEEMESIWELAKGIFLQRAAILAPNRLPFISEHFRNVLLNR